MPERSDNYDDVDEAEVEAAEAVEEVVRDPHHDEVTERESVEQALEEEDLSEAGSHLGDEID